MVLAALLAPSIAAAQGLACDDAIKTAFRPDAETTVVLVKPYAAGEMLTLPGDKAHMAPRAAHELCLVKLVVGPGNPGPEAAPSTTRGIGIEIWLPSPARWNGRIHAQGGGGFQGGAASMPDQVGNPVSAMIADGEGAVTSNSDDGHASMPKNYGIPDSGGDFLMNPDGSINEKLWRDFSERAIHEQAVKTKALAVAYYGKPPAHAYWDGSSTGGRQGHKLAQAHPEDFDGIIGNLPAMHWTRMVPAMVWPHIVFQRDLGGKPVSMAQQDYVSNAAIAACDVVGGVHLGYLIDPGQCRYNPVKDPAVICAGDGGKSLSLDCVSRVQAMAFNKIWYGPTIDGSVPDPALDNGWNRPLRGKQLWYGMARGTSLWNAFFFKFLGRATGVATPEAPTFLGTDQLALAAQDPAMAQGAFHNARSNGRNGWKQLSYAQFAAAIRHSHALNARFAGIDTDNPDLSAFKARGGKFLAWQGTNDEVIPAQGLMLYYDSVMARMGGAARVQQFYRMYVVPGAGHQSPNGTSNQAVSPPIFGGSQVYDLLTAWVEKGEVPPARIDLHSPPGSADPRSQPVCLYPQAARYVSGDPKLAESYVCANR
jgi:feruloyl esterase